MERSEVVEFLKRQGIDITSGKRVPFLGAEGIKSLMDAWRRHQALRQQAAERGDPGYRLDLSELTRMAAGPEAAKLVERKEWRDHKGKPIGWNARRRAGERAVVSDGILREAIEEGLAGETAEARLRKHGDKSRIAELRRAMGIARAHRRDARAKAPLSPNKNLYRQ